MFPMCVVLSLVKFQGGSTESAERRETQRSSRQGEEKKVRGPAGSCASTCMHM